MTYEKSVNSGWFPFFSWGLFWLRRPYFHKDEFEFTEKGDLLIPIKALKKTYVFWIAKK